MPLIPKNKTFIIIAIVLIVAMAGVSLYFDKIEPGSFGTITSTAVGGFLALLKSED